MSLRIRHLLLDVLTADGRYGRRLDFYDGVNVIRADNSMGKSTLMQSMIYALGLEGMLGPSHEVPLAHAATDFLEQDGKKIDVLESRVFIEIENARNEFLTVERTIKGSRAGHLMTVVRGRALTNPSLQAARQDYFVREPYAAVSERGFHRMLAEFIGWQLPSVPRYDDVDCPLYLEAIFPLLYVEQKLGWGKIPARYPTYLGIRDLPRRTVEFLLGLDAYKIATERIAVQDEMGRVRAAWSTLKSQTGKIAGPIAGLPDGIPPEPVAAWPPEIPPQILVPQSGKWMPLQNLLVALRDQLSRTAAAPVPSAGDSNSSVSLELRESETRLAERETLLLKLIEQVESDRSELAALGARIGAIEDDLRKHKDIGKLRKLGSEPEVTIGEGVCPTCHQEIPDSFLDTGHRAVPMSVEQNIEFLEEQLQLFRAVLDNGRASIETNEVQVQAQRTEIEKLRERIRTLRETITSPRSTPSIDAIAERIRLEQRIANLEYVLNRFDDSLAEFAQMADEWREVEKRRAQLPKGSLSEADKNKVTALENSFRNQLALYAVESLDPGTVGIARGDYEPEAAGLNLSADVSASDLIRMQWAYLLALLETGREFSTNHPGLLLMDEPQQQSVQEKDFRSMLAYAGGLQRCQLIVATSDESPTLPEFLTSAGVTRIHNIQGRTVAKM